MPARFPEPVVPFDCPKHVVPMATEFRSTWLTSSIKALRERRILDRYLEALPRKHHDEVLGSVAGVWLPIATAMAHYAACDSLALAPDEQIWIGRQVTVAAHQTSYSVVIRLAKEVGASPWSAFALQKRLWRRVWRGGDVATTKLAEKEALVEIAGWPCAELGYVRRAMHGVLLGQTELFCKKAYVHEKRELCTRTTLGYHVSWV